MHRVSCRRQTTAILELGTAAHKSIFCIGLCRVPATNMLGARPRSPEDDLLQELNPAKHHHVQEPSGPAREDLRSFVVVPAGYALKIHLEDCDLLLKPTPGSITQVSHPGFGFNIILVPQDLQVVAQPGQPVDGPCRPQEASLVDTAQEHLLVLQRGYSSASGSHIKGWENASRPAQESFMTPERHSPAVRVPEPSVHFTEKLSPMFENPVPPCPGSPSAPPSAERYAPWSIWSLRDSTVFPLPSSPLQPLPPSPPTSLKARRTQNHQKSPCTPCKTRKRLF
ncbi:proline-rich protein 23A3-like [Cricetulus griseus]|uniref:Proline-rich protein 23A3-like n=1 Tax=Cricetulus griseus TaxID=10029 RepID=A0A9J7JMS0_CRIGR|nr:proline-rich protein 23A3-like [Cricetulus griseus]